MSLTHYNITKLTPTHPPPPPHPHPWENKKGFFSRNFFYIKYKGVLEYSISLTLWAMELYKMPIDIYINSVFNSLQLNPTMFSNWPQYQIMVDLFSFWKHKHRSWNQNKACQVEMTGIPRKSFYPPLLHVTAETKPTSKTKLLWKYSSINKWKHMISVSDGF